MDRFLLNKTLQAILKIPMYYKYKKKNISNVITNNFTFSVFSFLHDNNTNAYL